MTRQTSRDRASLLGTVALVIALHALIAWLFCLTTRTRTLAASSRGLEIFFVAPPVVMPTVVTPPAAEPPAIRPGAGAARRSQGKNPPTTPPGNEPSIPPAIDSAAELSRAARDSSAPQAGPQPKDFGFPQSHRAPSPTSPEFSWSHARTHRVESIPGGGILVNLNDNCVLVLIPLPMVFCRPGKKPANGELFDHLHDAPAADDANGVP